MILKSLAAVLEERFWIVDSLLEENVFIAILQEGKHFPFPDEREKWRDGNIPKHFD